MYEVYLRYKNAMILSMKRCKLCSSNTNSIVDGKTKKIYHKCLVCQYIFLDKKFYINNVCEKKHYDKHHNDLESLGYVEMFNNLIDEFIEPYIKEIKTVLDFGCGEGEVLPILLEHREVKCDRYDLFYFPKKIYIDKQYDLILSTEVFEHLQNPLEILKELLIHLKKDAYLLLMSAFHPNDNDEFLKWWYIRDITHIGFFNITTFEHIASEFNLEIIKHNTKNIILFKKL
ncbi:MAG: class I SAM-dependent methyltransferase [Sulfurimonas sp.]|nr:class I SAM-dependent methyltransferase [Sulfurimonas sp.]